MIRYVGTVLISSRFLRIWYMHSFLLDAFPIDIPELDRKQRTREKKIRKE